MIRRLILLALVAGCGAAGLPRPPPPPQTRPAAGDPSMVPGGGSLNNPDSYPANTGFPNGPAGSIDGGVVVPPTSESPDAGTTK